MEDKIYKAKGYMYFCYSQSGLITQKIDLETIINNEIHEYHSKETKEFIRETIEEKLNISIYELMSGEEFLEYVEGGSITDYDGTLSEIFADGYITNLGLVHKGLQQGNFLVDAEIFEQLCNYYNIEVNWANK